MANFPTNPTPGDVHTDASGLEYTYQAVGAWKKNPINAAIQAVLDTLIDAKDLEPMDTARAYDVGEAFYWIDGKNYRVTVASAIGVTPTTDPGNFKAFDEGLQPILPEGAFEAGDKDLLDGLDLRKANILTNANQIVGGGHYIYLGVDAWTNITTKNVAITSDTRIVNLNRVDLILKDESDTNTLTIKPLEYVDFYMGAVGGGVYDFIVNLQQSLVEAGGYPSYTDTATKSGMISQIDANYTKPADPALTSTANVTAIDLSDQRSNTIAPLTEDTVLTPSNGIQGVTAQFFLEGANASNFTVGISEGNLRNGSDLTELETMTAGQIAVITVAYTGTTYLWWISVE